LCWHQILSFTGIQNPAKSEGEKSRTLSFSTLCDELQIPVFDYNLAAVSKRCQQIFENSALFLAGQRLGDLPFFIR
jgi:hypothetical protein